VTCRQGLVLLPLLVVVMVKAQLLQALVVLVHLLLLLTARLPASHLREVVRQAAVHRGWQRHRQGVSSQQVLHAGSQHLQKQQCQLVQHSQQPRGLDLLGVLLQLLQLLQLPLQWQVWQQQMTMCLLLV
jgi:hypothetical protein